MLFSNLRLGFSNHQSCTLTQVILIKSEEKYLLLAERKGVALFNSFVWIDLMKTLFRKAEHCQCTGVLDDADINSSPICLKA